MIRIQFGITVRYPRSPELSSELERIATHRIYEQRVFLVRALGFVTRTDARQISVEEALRFERIHEATYREFGFVLISVPPGSLLQRVETIKAVVRSPDETLPPRAKARSLIPRRD
jgi:predicted ATPase